MSATRKDITITRKSVVVKFDIQWGHGFTVGGETPAMVLTVRRTSPADKAGLMRGDFILTITGNSVYTVRAVQVQKMLDNLAGRELKLHIARPDPVPRNEQERRRALITLQTELNREKERKVDMSAFQSSYSTAMDDIGALLTDLGPIPVSRTPNEDKSGYSSSEEDAPVSKRVAKRAKKSVSPLTKSTGGVDGMYRFHQEEELESPAPTDDDDDDDDEHANDPLFDFNTQNSSGVCSVAPPMAGRDFSVDDFTDVLGTIRKDSEKRLQEKKMKEGKQPVIETTVAEYEPSFTKNHNPKSQPAYDKQHKKPYSDNPRVSHTKPLSNEGKVSPVDSHRQPNYPASNGAHDEIDGFHLYSKVNKPPKNLDKKASPTKSPLAMTRNTDPMVTVTEESKVKKSGSKMSLASGEYDDFASLFPTMDDFFLPEPGEATEPSPSPPPVQLDYTSEDAFDPGYAVVSGGGSSGREPKKPTSTKSPDNASSSSNSVTSASQNTRKFRVPSYSPPPIPSDDDGEYHDAVSTTEPKVEPTYDVVLPKHRTPARAAPMPPTAGKDKTANQPDVAKPGSKASEKSTASASRDAQPKQKAAENRAQVEKPLNKSAKRTDDRPSTKMLSKSDIKQSLPPERKISPKPIFPPPTVPASYDEVSGFCLSEDPGEPGYATVKHSTANRLPKDGPSRAAAKGTVTGSRATQNPTSDPTYDEIQNVSPSRDVSAGGNAGKSVSQLPPKQQKKHSCYDDVEYDDFNDFVPVRNEVSQESSSKPPSGSKPAASKTSNAGQKTKPQSSSKIFARSKAVQKQQESDDYISDLIVPLQDLGIDGKQKTTKSEHVYDEIPEFESGVSNFMSKPSKEPSSSSIVSTHSGGKQTSGKKGQQDSKSTKPLHRSAPKAPPPQTSKSPPKSPETSPPKSPESSLPSSPAASQPVTTRKSSQVSPTPQIQVPTAVPSVAVETSTDITSLEKGTGSSKIFFWKKKRAISQKDSKSAGNLVGGPGKASDDDGVMLKGYKVTSSQDYSSENHSGNVVPGSAAASKGRTTSPIHRTGSPASLSPPGADELAGLPMSQKKAVTSHDLKQRRRLSVQGQLELTCMIPEVAAEGLSFPVQDWNSEEVLVWLKQLNDFLHTNYHSSFKEHQITGRSLLRVQDYQLSQMGVDNQKHRSVLTTAISRLKIYQAGLDLKQMSS